MQTFAKVISFISNPVFISLPAPYLIVFKATEDRAYALKWELFSFIFIMINVGYVFYGILRGYFSDFDLTIKDERKRFFIFSSITTVCYLLFVIFLKGPKELIIAIAGFLLSIFIFSLVHKKLKASFHVATVTAFVLAMTILYGGFFIFGIAVIPLIAWSRIKTKHHTLLEVIAGGLVGAFVVFVIFIIAKLFLFG